MKYIGNIVTDSKFKEEGYNIVSNFEDIDKSLPTLIIGWAKAKKIFPELSMLNWQINDLVYWTYGKRERNYIYEQKIKEFQNIAINSLKMKFTYQFVNILLANKDDKKSLFNMLIDSTLKTFFVNDKMLYIWNYGSKKIIGLSLSDIEYEGGNINQLFKGIKKNEGNKIIYGIWQSKIPSEIIDLLKNNIYIIAYLID